MRKKAEMLFVVFTVTLALAMFCPWAYGQETSSGESDSIKGDKWQVEVIPYLWATALTGNVQVRGIDSKVDMSFADIWKDLDFGAMAHVEAMKGNWGFFADGLYVKLTADGDTAGPRVGPVSGSVKIKEWIVELGGLYRIGRWPVGEGRKISLDALGGGRYWYLESTLNFAAPDRGLLIDMSASKEWVDPFAGLRMRADLTRDLAFLLRGDIGGFGLGSTFSWNASGVFQYSFTPAIRTYLGYRAMKVDYESGSGATKFRYDVNMYGPIAGVGFRF
ncbi:MAG TPA: hypothetical protein VGJ94_19035 [Syntrophorhabdaceae bacterium]|jgi:hypothetical protein